MIEYSVEYIRIIFKQRSRILIREESKICSSQLQRFHFRMQESYLEMIFTQGKSLACFGLLTEDFVQSLDVH